MSLASCVIRKTLVCRVAPLLPGRRSVLWLTLGRELKRRRGVGSANAIGNQNGYVSLLVMATLRGDFRGDGRRRSRRGLAPVPPARNHQHRPLKGGCRRGDRCIGGHVDAGDRARRHGDAGQHLRGYARLGAEAPVLGQPGLADGSAPPPSDRPSGSSRVSLPGAHCVALHG